jgi:lipid II:glycine glycyltransferase (peptidoglycan interpeptide bridge formation enzyme)
MIARNGQLKASLRQVGRQEWEVLCRGFADYSYRQSWAYASQLAQLRGARAEFVAVEKDGAVIALASVRVRTLPVIGSGLAFISGGPMVRPCSRGTSADGNCESASRETLASLVEEYIQKRGLILRAAPAICPTTWGESRVGLYESAGFELSALLTPYRTLVVDLSRPVQDIRAGLQQKWRNCLNNAERQGLEVRAGTDLELVDEFVALYAPFRERKGFKSELGADFYAEVQRSACIHDGLVVQLAAKDGRFVAGHVSSFLGDTCVYLLGATSEDGLRCKAAYLLQWRTILLAKERDLSWYDLGGIDPEGNPGVYHFKAGLGGVERRSPGPFERRPRSVGAILTLGSESLYRRLVRVRGRACKS